MAQNESVGARIHPKLNEWLEEEAERQMTTKARLVETFIQEAKERRDRQRSGEVEAEVEDEGNSNSDEGSDGDERLPEGVYRPDSEKYDWAISWRDGDGELQRDYRKTREAIERKAKRLRKEPGVTLGDA